MRCHPRHELPRGWVGKIAQATIVAVFDFGLFGINNINPIEGVGSELLSMNVWAQERSSPAQRSKLVDVGCGPAEIWIVC